MAAFLLGLHLFLTIAGTVLGKAARDALFLSRYTPAQMLAADLVTTGAVAIAVAVEFRLRRSLSLTAILASSPLAFAAADLGLWLALSSSGAAVTMGIAYVVVGVQASLGVPHASLLAQRVLTGRHVRRQYALVGAGGIAGWVGGGWATQAIAAAHGTRSLLLATAALSTLGAVILSLACRAHSVHMSDEGRPAQGSEPSTLAPGASMVWGSRHLRTIAALVFLSSAVTTVAGLQFKVIASQSIRGTDQLAAFFGSFSLHAGLVALGTQLLLTPQILGAIGIGSALAIAPVALAAGSIGVLSSGSLAAAVCLKGSDQVLRYSIDRAALEALYRPLTAQEIFAGKTFIDALVCRLGEAGGTILVLGLVSIWHVRFPSLSLVNGTLILVWLAVTMLAGRRYEDALLRHLRQHCAADSCAHASASDHRPDRSSISTAASSLLEADTEVRLGAIATLDAAARQKRLPGEAARLLSKALGAELVGLAVLIGTGTDDPQRAGDVKRAADMSIDRILRILKVLRPDRYPACITAALRSNDPTRVATALEYLDATMARPQRQLLMPLLERAIA